MYQGSISCLRGGGDDDEDAETESSHATSAAESTGSEPAFQHAEPEISAYLDYLQSATRQSETQIRQERAQEVLESGSGVLSEGVYASNVLKVPPSNTTDRPSTTREERSSESVELPSSPQSVVTVIHRPSISISEYSESVYSEPGAIETNDGASEFATDLELRGRPTERLSNSAELSRLTQDYRHLVDEAATEVAARHISSAGSSLAPSDDEPAEGHSSSSSSTGSLLFGMDRIDGPHFDFNVGALFCGNRLQADFGRQLVSLS